MKNNDKEEISVHEIYFENENDKNNSIYLPFTEFLTSCKMYCQTMYMINNSLRFINKQNNEIINNESIVLLNKILSILIDSNFKINVLVDYIEYNVEKFIYSENVTRIVNFMTYKFYMEKTPCPNDKKSLKICLDKDNNILPFIRIYFYTRDIESFIINPDINYVIGELTDETIKKSIRLFKDDLFKKQVTAINNIVTNTKISIPKESTK